MNAAGVLDAYRVRLAIVKAYEADCAALALRCRLDAAERIAVRASARMLDGAFTMAECKPLTIAGLAAMARASMEITRCEWFHRPPWAVDLADAIMAELAAFGGAA